MDTGIRRSSFLLASQINRFDSLVFTPFFTDRTRIPVYRPTFYDPIPLDLNRATKIFVHSVQKKSYSNLLYVTQFFTNNFV